MSSADKHAQWAKGPGSSSLAGFALLLSIACLFHLAKKAPWAGGLSGSPLTFMALLLFLYPRSVVSLLVFVCVEAAVILNDLPNASVTNNWVLTLFIDLLVISAALSLVWKRKTRAELEEGLFEAFAPPARSALLILYVFSVLHKLNTGFVSVDTSCAVSQYSQLVAKFPFLPTGYAVDVATIWSTLILEGGIPILLVFRSTRTLGLAIGVLFHILLGLNNFVNFSALMFALYFLFVQTDASYETPRLKDLLSWLNPVRLRLRTAIAISLALTFVLHYVDVLYAVSRILGRPSSHVFILLGTIYGGAFLMWVVASRERQRDHRLQWLPLGAPLQLFILVLLVLNGLSPYDGLKTESVFSMFSNLKTEGGRSNHLFISPSLQIFDYERDIVRILDAGPAGDDLPRDGIIYFDFIRRISQVGTPGVFPITYSYRGSTLQFDDPQEAQVILGEFPYVVRKFFQFRLVPADGDKKCHH